MARALTRLVQILHNDYGRRVALVHDNELHLLSTYRTVYAFALAALDIGAPLRDVISTDLSGIVLDYDEVHALRSGWSFLPSIDHPEDLTQCIVSGCANAHTGSPVGRPPTPPWFYKGNGAHLRAHGESLEIPAFALSGAEEAELAGVWIIAPNGAPVRVGLTPGNEFADPALAAEYPSHQSHAKLRTCSIGPEIALDGFFTEVSGSVRIERDGAPLWTREVKTGEPHTQFTLTEVESALFRYDANRVPGSVHVHYLGGSVSSYGDGVRLQQDDAVTMEWQGFGRPLRNTIERIP